jgi:hypothetical protein
MARTIVFVGDVGTIFKFDVGVATVDCVSQKIIVRKPDKSCVEWVAEIGPGENEISYTAVAGDLDIKGKYALQPFIELPGWSGHGVPAELTVNSPVCVV